MFEAPTEDALKEISCLNRELVCQQLGERISCPQQLDSREPGLWGLLCLQEMHNEIKSTHKKRKNIQSDNDYYKMKMSTPTRNARWY